MLKINILNYFTNKAELDSCNITIQYFCNTITKCSNPWAYDYLLISSVLFFFSLEPSRPTEDSRCSLFQPVEKKRALDDNERRRSFYENLNYWEKLNHLQIYQLLNMAKIWSPLQLRISSNTSKNITRMLGIDNVVSLFIKINGAWEHPQTYW